MEARRVCALTIDTRPGTLAEMAGIFGFHKANIINLRMTSRDASFHTFEVDLEFTYCSI